MLPLPKPTDFAVDFPTVARSVAFGIVFWGIYYYLKPNGDATGNRTPVAGETVRHNDRYTMAPFI